MVVKMCRCPPAEITKKDWHTITLSAAQILVDAILRDHVAVLAEITQQVEDVVYHTREADICDIL